MINNITDESVLNNEFIPNYYNSNCKYVSNSLKKKHSIINIAIIFIIKVISLYICFH